jgi:hypothetical protein
MKTIVSVSLGSSARDHQAVATFQGQQFQISRRGVDGNFKQAQALLRELDGKVDAIGLGGVDIYLRCRDKRYPLRDGLRLRDCVQRTPVVDGGGLKDSLERECIRFLQQDGRIPLQGREALVVSALDRFGMAEALVNAGCHTVFGDKIFALSLDQPIDNLEDLSVQAEKLLPELSKLPISLLYPVGKSQNSIEPTELTDRYMQAAEIIAGDFHFIRKRLPLRWEGKTVLTNTVTGSDVELLRERGVDYLVTSTPELDGRSFGTNVLEAVLLTLLGKPWEEVQSQDYLDLIAELQLKPRVIALKG